MCIVHHEFISSFFPLFSTPLTRLNKFQPLFFLFSLYREYIQDSLLIKNYYFYLKDLRFNFVWSDPFPSLVVRRKAAAKKRKLKNLGKSKSTDTEEEDADDDGDDGELYFAYSLSTLCKAFSSLLISLFYISKFDDYPVEYSKNRLVV